jgi:ABC-type Fe3+/spermidine/putrescine transport system ATPase subunit
MSYPGAKAPALDRLSLDIMPGKLTALLGPSGCGKTTALKLIAGLLEPVSGDIAFDGRPVLSTPPDRRGAVMAFQNHLLFPYMSVADNIGFGLRMRNVPKAEVAWRVAEMLDMVRLPDFGARRPADLSGGQQQRVALARALIVQPKVLLLDEPLSNLDAHLRDEMRELIRGVQKQLGITTVFVTHDQQEAVTLADRVALILDGRLQQHDTPEAFFRRPADLRVARFFGGRNFVRGASDGATFDCALGKIALPAHLPGKAGPGILTFRPESVRIGQMGVNDLKALVQDRVYLGAQVRLLMLIGDERIEAIVGPDLAEEMVVGDTISISLPPQSLWVMEDGG